MSSNSIASEHLVAHRGHQHAFPENSLLGILDAVAAGARHIEFDVQLTLDGEIAIYHDLNMLRISGVDKNITELTRQELRTCTVSEPERLGLSFVNNGVDFLDNLLPYIQIHDDIRFYMEIKQESLTAFGEDVFFSRLTTIAPVIPPNLVAISFNNDVIERAKREGFIETALVFRDWDQRNQLLADANADFGYINYQNIPEGVPITADKPIIIYEIGDAATARALLKRGAFAIETFHIRTLLNAC